MFEPSNCWLETKSVFAETRGSFKLSMRYVFPLVAILQHIFFSQLVDIQITKTLTATSCSRAQGFRCGKIKIFCLKLGFLTFEQIYFFSIRGHLCQFVFLLTVTNKKQ